ncbi:MAG: hypothetical protein ACTSV5_09260 [Promethearchaeota archaeon]
MAKKISIYKEIFGEIKETIPKHEKGEYLVKPNEKEMKKRETARKNRKKELEEVEKAIRDKQVKFLATESELDEIKKSASLNRISQSEFIRSAIWEKISSLELKDIIPLQEARVEEEFLKEFLKNIKGWFKLITKLQRKALNRISKVEMQQKDITVELKEIKKRVEMNKKEY